MADEQSIDVQKSRNLTRRELVEQLEMFPDFFLPATDPHGLTMKQRLFVLYYVGQAKGNGAEAARMAGYSPDKPENARVTAAKWLLKSNIQFAIQELKKQLVESIKSDQLNTLRLLRAQAYADVRKLYGEDGALKKITDLDDETACAIETIEFKVSDEKVIAGGAVRTVPVTTAKVKFTSKAAARQDLLKIQGLLKDPFDGAPVAGLGIIYFPEKVPEGTDVKTDEQRTDIQTADRCATEGQTGR